ncbi:hypothetical protein QVD17_00239 [Tagetes erecta]|uniref:Plant PDR ABC transporter associated domain-containing protein n=1 Tax=Tagetes erecta TaxID=13708 RepID=A0AAD8L8E8_TARER|nr:hypothetical protein QVD17_00239 [Tagetes erecta]
MEQEDDVSNITIGLQTLESRGLEFEEYFFWISLGAMLGFALLFNIGFYFKAPGMHAIISKEKIFQVYKGDGPEQHTHKTKSTETSRTSIMSSPHRK